MSKYFELMNQLGRDSVAVQLTRAAPNSAPNLPNRYPQRVVGAPEQMSPAGLWRIIRNRKWTIAVFALVVVAIVVTASLLMKPQYEAVGRVRSEEHTSELQSQSNLVCRLLLEKKKKHDTHVSPSPL